MMRVAYIWMVVFALLAGSVALPGVLYQWFLISPFATIDVLIAMIALTAVLMLTFAVIAGGAATRINALCAAVLLLAFSAAMLYLRNELEAHV